MITCAHWEIMASILGGVLNRKILKILGVIGKEKQSNLCKRNSYALMPSCTKYQNNKMCFFVMCQSLACFISSKLVQLV